MDIGICRIEISAFIETFLNAVIVAIQNGKVIWLVMYFMNLYKLHICGNADLVIVPDMCVE
jgi:hypothetical protein